MRAIDEEGADAGVGDLEGEALGGKRGVEGDVDRSRHQRAEQGDDHRRPVVEEQADPGVLAAQRGRERLRDGLGPRGELAIAKRLALGADGRLRGAASGDGEEALVKRRVRLSRGSAAGGSGAPGPSPGGALERNAGDDLIGIGGDLIEQLGQVIEHGAHRRGHRRYRGCRRARGAGRPPRSSA